MAITCTVTAPAWWPAMALPPARCSCRRARPMWMNSSARWRPIAASCRPSCPAAPAPTATGSAWRCTTRAAPISACAIRRRSAPSAWCCPQPARRRPPAAACSNCRAWAPTRATPAGCAFPARTMAPACRCRPSRPTGWRPSPTAATPCCCVSPRHRAITCTATAARSAWKGWTVSAPAPRNGRQASSTTMSTLATPWSISTRSKCGCRCAARPPAAAARPWWRPSRAARTRASATRR